MVTHSTLTLLDTTIENNNADYGGGLIASGNSVLTISGVEFNSNFANEGGAVYATDTDSTFVNTVFIFNVAGPGGAVSLYGGTHTFDECTFSYNYADTSIFYANSSAVTLNNCSLPGNQAHMYPSSSTIVMEGHGLLTMSNSTLSNNFGNGVYMSQNTTGTVTNCTFTGHSMLGISIQDAYSDYGTIVTITGSKFSKNEYGGMVLNNSAGITIQECTFSNNGNGEGNGGGLGIFNVYALNIVATVFEYNTALLGGGMYVESGMLTTFQAVTYLGNTAEDGGGLWMAGLCIQANSIILMNNVATDSGGGMFIAPTGSFIHFDGGQIISNEAYGNGGGIYLNGGGIIFESQSILMYNKAMVGGGALCVSAQAVFSSVTISL